jgi:hypothetical protein
MKEYNSIYLGLCINNNDPEKRGRVQVFVPHIMATLYDGWNKDGNDITINCVGNNMPNGLTSDQLVKLQQILPWAECASPIIGTSSPGNLLTQAATALGNAVVGAANAVGNSLTHLFNQSPVSTPTSVNPVDQTALFNAASQYGGISPQEYASNSSSTGQCGVGARGILGAMTGNSYFAQGLGATGSSAAASLAGNPPSNPYLANAKDSGGNPLFQSPQSGLDSLPNPPPVGTTVVSQGGHSGNGHIQVWTGSGWTSNFSQSPDGASAVPGTNGILGSSGGVPYNNFTVYVPTDPNGLTGSPNSTQGTVPDRTSVAEAAAINVHSSPTSTINTDTTSPSYGSAASVAIQNTVTSSPSAVPGANAITPRATAYSPAQPGSPQYKQEGGTESSRVGPDGTNTVRTLQDVASGKSGYVTIAGDPSTYGQQYIIPSVTFTNAQGVTQTLTNVPAVVHDTGSAFTGAGTGHFDVAVDNGLSNSQLENQPFTSTGLQFQPANGLAAQAAANPQGAQHSTLVQNTNPHGAPAIQNVNNVAKGVFSFPAAGAILWVFFREGNPLYPVYFAASYSGAEWGSAYRTGSDTNMYRPEATPDNPVTSTGGIMNLGGVGGIRWEDTMHPTDVTKRQQSMMVFGEDGSNMFMGKGYHQIFSKFDRRDQVEGDRWNTTLGFQEEWIQGNYNHVTMGDVFVKIGNVSKPAVDAATRIQELIKQSQAPATASK